MTAANRIARSYPPEVNLVEPWTAWKQKSPQVGLGIPWVRFRLRVLLGRQLGLLGLLELFFAEIRPVFRAGHCLLGAGGR